VLETPFQDAPLDLRTDAFFIGKPFSVHSVTYIILLISIGSLGRSFEIYARLRDISNGKAVEFLQYVDERERSSSTSCIGVRWSYTFEELSQICEVSYGKRNIRQQGSFSQRFFTVYWTARAVPNLQIICRRIWTSYWRHTRFVVSEAQLKDWPKRTTHILIISKVAGIMRKKSAFSLKVVIFLYARYDLRLGKLTQ
jgi:hypothetical protein